MSTPDAGGSGAATDRPRWAAAVYFSALEALQNTAKYAHASHASVTLERTDGTLAFTVIDDGTGFDLDATGRGTGLQGMADRLGALDGDLDVVSRPGAGTTVRGTLPAAARDGPELPSASASPDREGSDVPV